MSRKDEYKDLKEVIDNSIAEVEFKIANTKDDLEIAELKESLEKLKEDKKIISKK